MINLLPFTFYLLPFTFYLLPFTFLMGSFGGFYKGDKKKPKKSTLEKKGQKQLGSPSWQLPQVEIIKKGKKEW